MVALVLAMQSPAAAPIASAAQPVNGIIPGADLFATSTVVRLQIELADDAVDRLRREPRGDMPARVREGNTVYSNVTLHVKGAVGSFRPIDGKPSLTLKFGQFSASERFHGLRQIHLNNSVEDPSFLNEKIGAELFRTAGVPASRVAHALVELNGRRLGLYVLKEGFAPEFLGLHFVNPNGELYEGSGTDVTNRLDRDLGSGPDEQATVKSLAATLDSPVETRWSQIRNTLDMERFLTFMVLEIMLGHRDGYCLARNNYRLYHDPATRRLVFLPHGMDQLFGNPDLPWRPQTAGLVATAVLATPEGRANYRERFGALLTNIFDPVALGRQADCWAAPLRTVMNRRESRAFDEALTTLKDRMIRRHRSLLQQLDTPELQPLSFSNGVPQLTTWVPVEGSSPATTIRGQAPDQRAALCVTAEASDLAAWQCRVLLPRGHYRFEGAIRIRGVEPLSFGKNHGAGLRVQGKPRAQPYQFVGDSDWRTESVEFEVTADQELVDLLCEIRARQGQAWFALDSLRIVQRR